MVYVIVLSVIAIFCAIHAAELYNKTRNNYLLAQKEKNKNLDILYQIEKKKQEIELSKKFLDDANENFNISLIQGRKWLAQMFADLTETIDKEKESLLLNKKRAAIKAAEQVKEANLAKRNALKKLKFLEYQLLSYKENFPFLEEYEEEILNDEITYKQIETNNQEREADGASKYLSEDEYKQLSPTERNKLALDRYLSGNLSKKEIGRFYERYIGYLYEKNGFNVEYFGIKQDYKDLGRDLICSKGDTIQIVQAKCWSENKTIRENFICQLFGTLNHFKKTNPGKKVTATLITSTQLSQVAKEMADVLKISYQENFMLDKQYPLIKCNISNRNQEKIYHLPFDQQYDNIKIEPEKGEFYVSTIQEAEAKGFRRAVRYNFKQKPPA